MRLLKIVVVTLVALAIWALLVLAGAREGWWRPLPAPRGNAAAFLDAVKAKIARLSNGDAAVALIAGGRVVGETFASRGRPVDRSSLFQVASMSKWVTAWGVMALVEKGRIDLDAPVSRYLRRWRLPPSAFDNDAVTVRRLLSHTAGLTDGLGYRGFAPGEKLQSIEASLTHAADAMPSSPGSVRVGLAPGSQWRYSGGGYTLLQLIIEEVSGEPFNAYMRRAVLVPLGMRESTFVAPDPARLADDFGPDGKPATRYTFTALAPASLYTSTGDMTRFLLAQIAGPHGEAPGRGVLSPATLEAMRRPQARLFSLPIWGLGNALYVDNNQGGFVIGHDGNNYPAINTTARLDPATGDGIVVLETGNAALASETGGDWTFWHSGHVDIVAIFYDARSLQAILAAGALVIVAAAGLIAWRGRRRKAAPPPS